VPAGEVQRFSNQYIGVNALARHLHVTQCWLIKYLKKSGTPMLEVPVRWRATTYFLLKETAAKLQMAPPSKSWR
jgi:aminopeptidase N